MVDPTKSLPFSSLVDCARAHAESQPEARAFTFLRDGEHADRILTFAELDQRARAIAHHLAKANLRGRRALLMFRPGLDFVEAMFGCLYAGVVAVPAYPPRQNRNGKRVALIAEDAETDLVLTSSEILDQPCDTDFDIRALTLLAVDEIGNEGAELWSPHQPGIRQPAVLQYTSGSTGRPKGVVLTHENLAENCRRIQEAFSIKAEDVGVSWLPTYHDMGLVGHVLETVWAGQPSILMAPVAFLQSPIRWLRAISDHGGAISGGPNFAYELCCRKISDEAMAGLDLSGWDIAYNGSEAVRADTLDRFAERFAPVGFRREAFYPCYGMAESTLIVTGGQRHTPTSVIAVDAHALSQGKVEEAQANTEKVVRLVSCGSAVGGELLIVDPESKLQLDELQVGEVWVANDSVAPGYFERQRESSKTFHATLAEPPPNGKTREFLRTGDLGFLRNGELFITGRIKDLIIVRGVNRYPQDVERAVESSDTSLLASGVAAFSVDAQDKERLVVVCEIDRHQQTRSEVELVKTIRQAVSVQQSVLVDAVAFVRKGGIPKTSSGKTQRYACKQSFLDNSLGDYYRWTSWQEEQEQDKSRPITAGCPASADPLNYVFEVVRGVAEDRAEQLTADSNLVELGLDSLERIEIATRIESAFAWVFSDAELQRVATCGELAALIQKKQSQSNGHSVKGIPPQHAIDEFPEYQQLKRAQQLFANDQVHNPFHQLHDGVARATTQVGNRTLISFSTYNYLGLSGDPLVAAAAKRAIDRYGTSVSASRVVAGERPIHRQLETEIAAWIGTQDALTFVGGHSTNETTIGHLVGPHDLIVHDELAHNSILQGAVLSGADRRSFPHNRWEALDELLKKVRSNYRRVLVAIEGVYSMDGDFPDLPRFVELRNRHRVLLMVDEAHSLGTMGLSGRGISEHFGLSADQVDIWMGTLSKSLGSCGGYIAGSEPLIELLRYTAPGFVYSVGISPANAAAALAALHRLHADPSLVAKCRRNADLFRSRAKALNLDIGMSHQTPIVPIILKSSRLALTLAHRLHARGISVHPILYPAVPESAARLRFFVSAEHSEQQIVESVEILGQELQALSPQRTGVSRPRTAPRMDPADPSQTSLRVISHSPLSRP